MAWQAVVNNPRQPRGRVVPAETLQLGDVVSFYPYAPHTAEVIGDREPVQDRFSRDLFRYRMRIISGPNRIGDEGYHLYGPGGKARVVKRAR